MGLYCIIKNSSARCKKTYNLTSVKSFNSTTIEIVQDSEILAVITNFKV